MQDGGGKHDDGDKHSCDRRRQDRTRPIGRLQDRQCDEAGVRHRRRPPLHGGAGESWIC